MFYKTCVSVLILLLLVFNDVTSQNCREYSQTCRDDKGCCGGCCLNGICRDTYEDCRQSYDPCMDIYCPPDEDCYVFQPQNCEGCGPIRECRSAPPPPEEIVKPNKTFSSSANRELINIKIMLLLFLSIIYFM